MNFPNVRYEHINSYLIDYVDMLSSALKEIDTEKLDHAIACINSTITKGGNIFLCGNGGSAAISNHFVCDFVKGLSTGTKLRPKVISLNSNIELYSAIANDISFDEIFSYQIERFAFKRDVLRTVSSSGNSQNIINGIEAAKKIGCSTIALSGFSGGRSGISDFHLHIKSDNYGIIEDAHHAILHIIAQFLRMRSLSPEDVKRMSF